MFRPRNADTTFKAQYEDLLSSIWPMSLAGSEQSLMGTVKFNGVP